MRDYDSDMVSFKDNRIGQGRTHQQQTDNENNGAKAIILLFIFLFIYFVIYAITGKPNTIYTVSIKERTVLNDTVVTISEYNSLDGAKNAIIKASQYPFDGMILSIKIDSIQN
jgi:dipeptide/tripeptide permease